MKSTKDLNKTTYSIDICYRDMPDTTYKGLKINISNSAIRELFKEGKDINLVKKILEIGYDAPRKRKKDTIEKWYDKGKKTYNAVIKKD